MRGIVFMRILPLPGPGAGALPPGNAPGGNAPGGNAPGGNASGGNAPGGNAPGGNAPGGNAPGGNASAGSPGTFSSEGGSDDIPAGMRGGEGLELDMLLLFHLVGIARAKDMKSIRVKYKDCRQADLDAGVYLTAEVKRNSVETSEVQSSVSANGKRC
jgi:hypothetical protein